MKTGLYLAFFILVSAFRACEKDDDAQSSPTPPAPQSRHDILVSHYWKLSNVEIRLIADTNFDSVLDTSYSDNPPDSCTADDKNYFKSNGYVVTDLGSIICSATADSVTWSLINSDTQIVRDTLTADIVSLSSSQFVSKKDTVISTFPYVGATLTITLVYP